MDRMDIDHEESVCPLKESTLLKYGPPQLVSELSDYTELQVIKLREPRKISEDLHHTFFSPTTSLRGFPQTPQIPGLTKDATGSHDSGYSKAELKQILNTILPPVQFVKDGRIWRSEISCEPATRLELLSMREHLIIKLHQQQANEKGICPIRHELFSQAFDELIRQITLDSAERGLLLVRIRDELRMTICAYGELFHCSSAYGIQKSILSEGGRDVVNERYVKKLLEKKKLEELIQDIKDRLNEMERKHAEVKEILERKHLEDVQFYKRSNQQLKAQLDGILETKIVP